MSESCDCGRDGNGGSDDAKDDYNTEYDDRDEK